MHVLTTDGRAIIQNVRPILDLVGHSTSQLSILILCSASINLLGNAHDHKIVHVCLTASFSDRRHAFMFGRYLNAFCGYTIVNVSPPIRGQPPNIEDGSMCLLFGGSTDM